MFSKVFGDGCYNVVYSMLILAVSAFCLTSVDTATRLARYMFQEFFTNPGETRETMPGWKKVLTNPYVATAITVVAGVALGMTGYAKIWALFGAANQLLAALGLLAVCCWLGKIGRNNKMFYFPMFLHADRDPDLSGVHHQGSVRWHRCRRRGCCLVLCPCDHRHPAGGSGYRAGGGGHPGPVPQQQEGCRCQITAA